MFDLYTRQRIEDPSWAHVFVPDEYEFDIDGVTEEHELMEFDLEPITNRCRALSISSLYDEYDHEDKYDDNW